MQLFKFWISCIYILYLDIYNISCIYIIWYVTYDGYHIEISKFIIPMFLMQQPYRVSDAPLLFWLGYLPVYLAPFVFKADASKFQFLWSPAKKPHPLVWKGLGKLVAIQISMVIIVVVVIAGDTVIQSDVSLIPIHYQMGHFKVFSTLFEPPVFDKSSKWLVIEHPSFFELRQHVNNNSQPKQVSKLSNKFTLPES